MNFVKLIKDGSTLYQLPDQKRASVLELKENPTNEFGFNAAGTVHHIAFRAKNEKHRFINTGRKRYRSCEMTLSKRLMIMGSLHVSSCKILNISTFLLYCPPGSSELTNCKASL